MENKRSFEKMVDDSIKAFQRIDFICRRAHTHGVDMDDIREIEEQVDKAMGTDRHAGRKARKK